VKRTINGATYRYIERMHERQIEGLDDSFFVDSGLEYRGDPVTHLTGLNHLEGETVVCLGDGRVFPETVVHNGAIDLPEPVSHAVVGLPITSMLRTLPMVLNSNDGGYAQGRNKNINKIHVRVYRSSALRMGPDEDGLRDYPARLSEPYGSPPDLRSEELSMAVSPKWQAGGQMLLEHRNPLPLMVVAITADVAV
jgi:hypothetical protein